MSIIMDKPRNFFCNIFKRTVRYEYKYRIDFIVRQIRNEQL